MSGSEFSASEALPPDVGSIPHRGRLALQSHQQGHEWGLNEVRGSCRRSSLIDVVDFLPGILNTSS